MELRKSTIFYTILDKIHHPVPSLRVQTKNWARRRQAPLPVEIGFDNSRCCWPPGCFPPLAPWTTGTDGKQVMRTPWAIRQQRPAPQLWGVIHQVIGDQRCLLSHHFPVQGRPELRRVVYLVEDGREFGVASAHGRQYADVVLVHRGRDGGAR